ncbi:hypothetical protein GCM10023091_40510 [Ravibacter arvi]|uniref:Heparinase II/III-like protein n=1 Tax=Ravibacter arvi TaxID=2051041 RepID=A0ABP8M975_9BACT
MRRRIFLQKASTIALLPLVNRFPENAPPTKETLPQWLLDLAPVNDLSVEQLAKYQERRPGPDFGGLTDHQQMFNAHSTSGFVRVCANALSLPNSKFYRSEELPPLMDDAMAYLLKLQHQDGTIDLLSTNFHSTPDVAFLVKRLTHTYRLLQQSGMKSVAPVEAKLKTFLLKAGDGLSVGGIHTPNHRWVVSGALASLYSIWPETKYLNRIEQWLSEGIDLDPDGQFNERSTYIYSSLTDRVLISVADYAKKPYILDYVRKNLAMTRYYVHPNAEIVTDASGRQDKAIVGNLENYYYPYRYLALKDGNQDFAGMCRFIEKTAGNKIVTHLDYFLTDPSLWKELPNGNAVPTKYVKAFPHSGLVRIREDNWDASIIAKNPAWLTFMKDNAVIQGIRFASSFFGKGQFTSEKINETGGSWKLTQHLEGPYFQPLPPNRLPGDGDWEKMPKSERPQSEIQKLDTTVTIRKNDSGIEIEISATGTDRVPVALELIFREGGELKGVEAVPGAANSWLLKEGTGTFTRNGSTLTFGPGIARHLNTALRGALPHSGAPSVFLTGFTPFQHTLKLV